MLRRAKQPKGLCVHCAAHDWLRNTYPPNVLLAQSGPRVLLHPDVRKLFGQLMQTANADAKLEEINWNLIIENWELPFPDKMKPTGKNPVTEKELKRIKDGEKGPPCGFSGLSDGALVIHSFEELNDLKPGLGDDLKRCLDNTLSNPSDEASWSDEPPSDKSPDEPPPEQLRLF